MEEARIQPSDPSRSARAETDEELARRVQSGDKEVFGALMERYEQKLLRYGAKFLATHDDIVDIVQDVFIRTYQNIQSFDTSQRFSPWIYRIAHNAFVNALKRRSYNPLTLVDFDTFISHVAYEDPAPKERERKEMRAMIDKGLEELQPKYREVLILHYLEDMPYKEIADILQIPSGTVGIRIKRAKEALKGVYQKMNLDYGA
ncbi:MAG TPA: RNA polymerase sigma factor [Candidatus Paceibacterota bacterium]|nr:RNA polymerase sigma factor [Candidatus Paceibacterota bacterium]